MKKLLILFVMLLAFAGCATMSPFATTTINPGEERFAGVGDTFFEHTEGSKMNDPMLGEVMGSAFKYDLTVLELTQEKIGLQYNEFIYSSGSGNILYPSTYAPAGWMVKQGFNKRFDYAIADGVIRFKGYEFEVLSVENGQIKYKRIK